MKIKRINIQNLLSFENVDFDLYDFNVIVGMNASGKTNLLRLLNFIREDENSGHHMDYRRLEKKSKLDQDKKSSVILELELADSEALMLMHLVFKKDLDGVSIPESFKKVRLGFYWEDVIDDETLPILIFRFSNGLSIIRYGGNDWLCWLNEMPIVDASEKFKALIDVRQGSRGDFRGKYQNKHNFLPDTLFNQDVFTQKLMSREPVDEFLTIDRIGIKVNSPIEDLKYGNPVQMHQKKVYEFINMDRQTSHQISLWHLLTEIMVQRLTTIKELRPDYDSLAKMLFELKTVAGNEEKELLLSQNFSKIFPHVTYDVRIQHELPGREQPSPKITIDEVWRRFSLDQSAAGYFEVLYLLFNTVHAKETVIVLDEPALHLHHLKIKQLGQSLREMVEKSGNQIIIITHSISFVDYSIVATSNQHSGLVYVKRDKTSHVYYRPQDLKIDLKPHLFRPEIFFSKCNIFVEGPGDYAALAAISEGFGNILDANDIELIFTWGKGNIKTYIPLLDAYKVPYFGMADSDYDGSRENMIILDKDLENELRKLGWDAQGKFDKILPVVAYEFMSELVKTEDGKKKIKQTPLYSVIEKAIRYTQEP